MLVHHYKRFLGFALMGLFFSIFCLLPGPSWGEKKTVKLGFVADITGPGFLIALSQKNALELGLEEINSSGGLLGRRVELIIRDSQMNRTGLPGKLGTDLRIKWILCRTDQSSVAWPFQYLPEQKSCFVYSATRATD
jgi:hypothetical protein